MLVDAQPSVVGRIGLLDADLRRVPRAELQLLERRVEARRGRGRRRRTRPVRPHRRSGRRRSRTQAHESGLVSATASASAAFAVPGRARIDDGHTFHKDLPMMEAFSGGTSKRPSILATSRSSAVATATSRETRSSRYRGGRALPRPLFLAAWDTGAGSDGKAGVGQWTSIDHPSISPFAGSALVVRATGRRRGVVSAKVAPSSSDLDVEMFSSASSWFLVLFLPSVRCRRRSKLPGQIADVQCSYVPCVRTSTVVVCTTYVFTQSLFEI